VAALTDESKLWKVFALANKALAVVYVGLACVVAFSVAQKSAGLVGGLVLALLILALALGHFLCKGWALKASAATFAVVALLAIPYLFSTYEQALVPALYVRVSKFILLLCLALAMSANYLLYKRLGDRGR